jgi:glycosyltransferase involved in cell wall biosynthesis
MDEKISFVIPALNAERTIGICLDSIKRLDYPSGLVEVIVVDNGSVDNTVKIARDHGAKVVIEHGVTVSRLRNIGSERSSGEYIAFVDADCELPVNWAKDAVFCLKNEDAGMAGTRSYAVPENSEWWKKAWKAHTDANAPQGRVKWVVGGAIIVKREVFLAVGGFDGSLVTCEDVAFGYAVSKRYKVINMAALSPLHHEASGTIKDLYKKELWRSAGNVRVMMKNLGDPSELKIFAVIVYYLLLGLLLVPAVVMSLLGVTALYIAFWALAFALPVCLMSMRVCVRTGETRLFFGLCAVYVTYIAAKVGALFLK